ncbi:hypothetical protein BDA99DRAFT_447589 [Phascolomyces articulosus]|uniref:RING-type E3 ubiquitin transferase n=1 Tax=Phascolomyces articulosus TaxID=60185 RepID=A0AAD5JYV6_9FUNG|nr:hypothetical protein BDA99DRAFT_447589 [Phascolomyces articulosus]
MVPTNESMISSRTALIEQIDKRVEELKSLSLWGDQIIDDRELPMSVNFGCVFEIFAQLEPVPSDVKLFQLLEYEKETENPQGISTIRPPPLKMSSVMYSPNCGLAMTSDDGVGTKLERYYSKAVSYATMAIILAIIQIFALIHQMEYTPTPSSVSNVSYWTIAMQSMMDGYLCLLHLTTAVVIETVFMPFATAAFFSFILVSVFGMRYLLLIWRIQRPESTRPSNNNNNDNPNTNRQEEQNTILPLANRPQTTPQPVSDPRHALLLFGLFLFYQTATRSAFVQSIIIGTLGFGFYSYWIPQIVRNIIRGCRRPLSRRYVIGMSITRLAIPLYFYGCPDNLIAHEPSPWIWALVAFVALQVLILFLQDILGPRFFVPEKYLPQTYNYHPILPAEDEENLQENGGKSSRHPRDCAICMLPVDTSPGGPPGLHVLGRAQYMLTPCQHLFHTDCLERVSIIILIY